MEFELPSYQSIDDNCEITYSLQSQNPEIDLPIGFTVDTANKIEPKLVYQDVTGASQGTFELNLIALTALEGVKTEYEFSVEI